MAPPEELTDDLVGEFLLHLASEDPACLLRASLVCKRWRRILADPAFRRRHRAHHRTPPVVGFIRIVSRDIPYCSRFVPINAASRLAARNLPGWLVVDCRHGRALFVTPAPGPGRPAAEEILDFVVWDPLTNEQHRLPEHAVEPRVGASFNAAVLCAAATEGCDHRDCHGGPFRVVYVITAWHPSGCISFASVYSSESGDWSEHPIFDDLRPDKVFVYSGPCPSALVGDSLYFRGNREYAFEYRLGAQRLSVIDQPDSQQFRFLMSVEDGKLGFVDVDEQPRLRLRLWLRETTPGVVARWARGRDIDLKMPLPDGHPRTPQLACVIGFAEGTGVIFVLVRSPGRSEVYMVELNSGRARKVSNDYNRENLFPYTRFCIPVVDAPARGEGPRECVSSA